MDNILSLLYHVFIGICFCAAIFMLFLGFNRTNLMFSIPLNLRGLNVLQQQMNTEEILMTSYDEVVGMFLSGLEQDVTINGCFYDKNLSEFYVQEGLNILLTNYQKDCIYDNDGSLVAIVFTSVS